MSDIILTNTISVYAKQVPMNDTNVLDKLEIQQVGQTSHLRNTTEYQNTSHSALQGRYLLCINLVYSLQQVDAMPCVVFHYDVSVREIKDASQGTSPCVLLKSYIF